MEWYYILLIILSSLIVLTLLTSYICFYIVFYITKKEKRPYKEDEYDIPPGDEYQEHKELLTQWMKDIRKVPYKTACIKSYDNLKLYGKYYDCGGDTIEIMFHGYRGNAERDLCGGVRRAFALNHNVLLVDQRASKLSDGHITTFGIKERFDCLSWVDYVIKTFGDDIKIILTGVSMGAATVIMASEFDLPKNVIGVLADCSYTSPKEVIKKVIKQLKLPPAIFYPIIYLGAKLFGGFNLEASSPIKAIKNAKVPVIIFHGSTDNLVPAYMGKELYDVNPTVNKLVVIEGAGHCLGYVVEPESYLKSMDEFFSKLKQEN